MRLSSPVGLFGCVLLCGVVACDDADTGGTGVPTAGSARPSIDVVVRTVKIKKNLTTPAADGKGDDEKWTAIAGKAYAIVTAEMAHRECKAGDKIETSKALLKTPEGDVKPVGGGARPERLCVQCQPTDALDCSTASRLRPFTFIFEVGEKSDVKKAKLVYREREAPLEKAKIIDARANDEIAKEIAAKQDELRAMKKKLENTSNLANGKVIQSEMARIEKEIKALEKKQEQ